MPVDGLPVVAELAAGCWLGGSERLLSGVGEEECCDSFGQVVLIGDHQQLRPKINTYDLCRPSSWGFMGCAGMPIRKDSLGCFLCAESSLSV